MRTKMDLWFCLIEGKTGERQWVKSMTWAQADAKHEELRNSGFQWHKSESNKA